MGVRRELNQIHIYGKPGMLDVFRTSSAIFQAVDTRGYEDITLNFADCESVFERFVLPVACLSAYYNNEYNVPFDLVKPKDPKLASLFHNANWSHLIDPEHYEATTFEGAQHVPASQFFTSDDHF